MTAETAVIAQATQQAAAVAGKLAPGERLVTIMEACTIAAVSRRTIYNWLGKGWLVVRYTPSGTVRIAASSLIREARSPRATVGQNAGVFPRAQSTTTAS